MFGAIFAGFLLVGVGVRKAQRSYEDYKSRESAIEKCNSYYVDSYGCFRSTWDCHKVALNVRDANGDIIDKDLKTGKTLRNYSGEQRARELRRQEKELEKNIDNLYIARHTGEEYYKKISFDANGERHIEKTDVRTGKKYVEIKDGKDVETGLYVKGVGGKNTRDAIEDAKFINNWIITDSKSDLRKNRTKEEALAYAKEIGALL